MASCVDTGHLKILRDTWSTLFVFWGVALWKRILTKTLTSLAPSKIENLEYLQMNAFLGPICHSKF